MRRRDGDVWSGFIGAAAYATVIQTNGSLDKNGYAEMKSGEAKRAATMWPDLPRHLGKLIDTAGLHVYVLPVTRQPGAWTVSFPVRTAAANKPDLDLIERSTHELVALADAYGWAKVFMTRPGCDNLNVNWERHVRPILLPLLDDRFVVYYDSKVVQEQTMKRQTRKPVSKRMGAA